MKTLIPFFIVLMLLFPVNTLKSQTDLNSPISFQKGLRVTYGVGYMKEWKNDRVRFGTPSQELSSPNAAFITWLSVSYNQPKGWFIQTSFDLELTNENDLNEDFLLRSLHFSLGKQVLWAGKDIRLFTGLSSVRRIGFTGTFTQLPSGEIEYQLEEGETTGFLFPHIGTEFLSDLNKSFQIGLRIKGITNFDNFGRIDLSGFISYQFRR